MTHRSALVLGGGITGLTCAYTLDQKGIDFLLIEKEPRLGGTIRTQQIDDFILDTGPDAFLTQKPEALSLCRELGLESRLVPTNPDHRNVFIFRAGRLHPLPEGMVLTIPTRILPFALSGLFSPWGKLRMGLEVLIPPRRAEREESIASFIKRRLGGEALERLAEPLLAGIHSGDPELLSMDQLFPRFVALEQKHGSLIRGMRTRRPRGDSSSSRSIFMSLAGGLSELIETLAAKLPKSAVRCGAEVTGIEHDGPNYVVETTSGERHTAKTLVLSLPIKATRHLSIGLSSDFTPILSRLRTVSTAIVFLAFRREEVRNPLDGYGFVVPVTEGIRIQAGTFVSTKFPNRSPSSHVLLRAFFGGDRDPTAVDLSDRELADLAIKELGEILGPLPVPVLERVYRWSDATPQVEVGHRETLTALEKILQRFPGLEIAGNGIRGVGIPDCISDGRRRAESVLRYLADESPPQEPLD